jgi:hypothetical protein
MNVTFFLKLGTFFKNYFGKLDMLINTLVYVRHFDILCIHKLCQKSEYAYVYENYHKLNSRITNNSITNL